AWLGEALAFLDQRLIDDPAEVVAVAAVTAGPHGVDDVANAHRVALLQRRLDGGDEADGITHAPATTTTTAASTATTAAVAVEPADLAVDRVQLPLRLGTL